MITHASFRNFKSLREVDIEFERLTVIVGQNASGKTSILEGIRYLSLYSALEASSASKSVPSFEHLYSRPTHTDPLKLTMSNDAGTVRLIAEPPPGFSYNIPALNISRLIPNLVPPWRIKVECLAGGEWRSLYGTPENDPVAKSFGSVWLLRLDPRALAKPSHPRLVNERSENGEGLASRLALMALKEPDRFDDLQQRLRTLFPSLRRIRFDRIPVTKLEIEFLTVENVKIPRQIERTYQEDQILFDFNGPNEIQAEFASEGTLLALGIIAELVDADLPDVLLIDDIEHGLHPRAQRELVALIRKILEAKPSLQIIATTHSPYIVDEIDASGVRITWASDKGATRCARLDSHPEFERWKDELVPGELWSIMGEEWISKPRVAEVPSP